MGEARATRSLTAGSVAAALFGSLVAVVLFSSTGQDDCHITFWAAHSLAELGEILNHSGERVEQSSSLLHTVLLALLARVTGAPIPWLAYGLGIVAAVAAVLRMPALARACGFELRRGSLLVLSTAPAFAYWQLGSLESSLFTWGCVEFLIGLVRLHGAPDEEAEPAGWRRGARGLVFVLGTGALAASRPEAGILAVCVAALLLGARSLFERRARAMRGPWLGLLVPALWLAALVAFRLAYFERPFPQPVVAKMGGAHTLSIDKLLAGAVYLGDRFTRLSGMLLAIGVLLGLYHALLDLRGARRGGTAPLWLVLGYLAFTILSGGDWMKGWRFVAHVEPLIVLLLLLGLDRLRFGPRAWAGVCAGLLAVNLHGMVDLGGGFGTGRPIWTAWQVDPAVRAFANDEATWPERANQVHTRDVVMVDEMNAVLERVLAVQESARILSKQAGLVTYYAARAHGGRIEFVDRLGLSSRHFEALQHELGLRTEPMGLAWDLEDFFRAGAGRSEPCFRPDVIFDLHLRSSDLVERLGFVVVYEQAGLSHGRFAGAAEREARPRAAGDPAPMDLLRVRPQRRLFEGKSPWAEETNMYQFIAVRAELAERAGLVSVAQARAVLGPEVAVSAHALFWDVARRPFLRDGKGATRAVPGAQVLPRLTRFATELALDGSRRVVRFDATLARGPRLVLGVMLVGAAGPGMRLREGRHYHVAHARTPELELRLAREELPAYGTLRIEGLALGPERAGALARFVE